MSSPALADRLGKSAKGRKMQHYSAEWYRSVMDSMHDMVLVKGPDSHLLWGNKAFLDYYGMTEDELFQIVDAEHSDPDDTLQYVKDDLTALNSGKSLDIPQEAVTDAAGDARYFHTIKSPMFEGKKAVGTVGLARLLDDIAIPKRDTDHKDAKAFVAPIRALVESFPNPMLMVDVAKRVICVSPLWHRHFGGTVISADSFFGDAYPALTDLRAQIKDCLEGETSVESLISVLGPDGQNRLFSAHTSPWHYKDGSVGGATVIATDVTMFHAQAEVLEKTNDELMQFSYRASHDLKGPLTTVKGLARFIAMDIASGDLEDAHMNAGKIEGIMTKLEKTVLSFLSLAQADVTPEPGLPLDLAQAISGICEGLSHHLEAAGVAVRSDLKVTRILGHHARITQVLENLISNAVKFHDPQKSDRFVQIKSWSAEDGAVMLSVEDNGCGIPSKAGDKIFDMFSRFHQDSEGTGLGLAIVKKHVDAFKGQIWVTDTGGGSKFQIMVPRAAFEVAG